MKILLLLLVGSYCLELEPTLNQVFNMQQQIKSSEFGKAFLQKIPINDPIDVIIHNISEYYDNLDKNLEESTNTNKKFQGDCKEIITQMKKDVKHLSDKIKNTRIAIERKKPRFELIQNRYNNKKKMKLQLELDLQRQIELREVQIQLFDYNLDQLDKATEVITEIRNKFIKFLSQRHQRQRKVKNSSQFLEEDDYNEEEEEKQHYEKFAFIQMIVAIDKRMQGMDILTNLVEGIKDVCQQLHDIKEGTVYYEDSEATLNYISKQVIDICTNIMDWIGQLRRREQTAEDKKHDITVQIVKLAKKQISESEVEISSLGNEVSTLHQQLDQLEQSEYNTQYSLQTNQDLLKNKIETCQQQQFDYQTEKKMIEEQLEVVGLLLDLLVQKGGQFKKHLQKFGLEP